MTTQRVIMLKPINHVKHGILTFFTGGAWGLVWLAVWLNRKAQR